MTELKALGTSFLNSTSQDILKGLRLKIREPEKPPKGHEEKRLLTHPLLWRASLDCVRPITTHCKCALLMI